MRFGIHLLSAIVPLNVHVRDFKRLQADPPSGIQAAPLDNNVLNWQAVIFGPDDTPWEGGTFQLLLEFTEE